MISRTTPRPLDRSRPEVDTVIAELRPLRVPLSVERIAIQLGLQVEEHRFQGPVRGAAVGERFVVLDVGLRGALRAEVFAHEVAHVLQRRGHFSAIRAEEAELFADQFARELLVPRAWLVPMITPAHLLARQLGVGRALLAMQLGVAGAAPGVLRDRRAVLCASCGNLLRDRGCVCRPFRENKRLRRRLSDLRALPGFEQGPDPQLAFSGLRGVSVDGGSAVLDWSCA